MNSGSRLSTFVTNSSTGDVTILSTSQEQHTEGAARKRRAKGKGRGAGSRSAGAGRVVRSVAKREHPGGARSSRTAPKVVKQETGTDDMSGVVFEGCGDEEEGGNGASGNKGGYQHKDISMETLLMHKKSQTNKVNPVRALQYASVLAQACDRACALIPSIA